MLARPTLLSPEQFVTLREEAASPNTPPDRLEQIDQEARRLYYSDTPARQVRRLRAALLANPNSPPDTLLWHAISDPEALLTNPVLPLLPLEDPNFTTRLHDETMAHLLRFANVPAAIVQQARQRPRGEARRQAEWHIVVAGEADPATDDWEREAFATLESLGMSQPDRAFEIVEHFLPDAALVRLFERVGLAAVHEPEHAEYAKRQRAAERARRHQEREAYRASRGQATLPKQAEFVRRLEARQACGEPPEGWEAYWEANGDWARDVAASPLAPSAMLASLAHFAASPTWRDSPFAASISNALLHNPVTPTEALRTLFDRLNFAHLALHPNADTALLRGIAAEGIRDETLVTDVTRFDAVEALLGNPKTPPETVRAVNDYLNQALQTPGLPHHLSVFGRRIRRWHPALHPDGPKLPHEVGETYRHQNFSDYFPKLDFFLRTLVRPYTVDRLASIAREREWTRRFAAAWHQNATPRIWKYLAADGNRFVRACARARMRG